MELLGARIIRSRSTVDFEMYYVAGYQVRTHPSQMYDLVQQDRLQRTLAGTKGTLAFYHPSYEALIFVPLSLLKFRTAYLIFIALNMLFLIAAFFAARPTFSSVIPFFQPRPGLMFVVFIPVYVSLMLGQDGLLSLLIYCLAWRQLEAGKDLSGGCLVALALFKFHIAIPIAVLIAIRRGKRFASGFLLTAAGLVLLCFGIVGMEGVKDYIRLLLGVAYIAKTDLATKITVVPAPYCMPNLGGLLYGFGARFLHSPVAFDGLVVVFSLALFLWCARVIRRRDVETAFSIAVLCGLLLSFHLLIYDITLLLLPIAVFANRMNRYVLLGLFILPFVTPFLGTQWIFLIAVPMLAMLVNVIVSTQKPLVPSSAVADAAPV
jgi:hypothetical protein